MLSHVAACTPIGWQRSPVVRKILALYHSEENTSSWKTRKATLSMETFIRCVGVVRRGCLACHAMLLEVLRYNFIHSVQESHLGLVLKVWSLGGVTYTLLKSTSILVLGHFCKHFCLKIFVDFLCPFVKRSQEGKWVIISSSKVFFMLGTRPQLSFPWSPLYAAHWWQRVAWAQCCFSICSGRIQTYRCKCQGLDRCLRIPVSIIKRTSKCFQLKVSLLFLVQPLWATFLWNLFVTRKKGGKNRKPVRTETFFNWLTAEYFCSDYTSNTSHGFWKPMEEEFSKWKF